MDQKHSFVLDMYIIKPSNQKKLESDGITIYCLESSCSDSSHRKRNKRKFTYILCTITHVTISNYLSEQRDLNPRPPSPQDGALPSCAMLRYNYQPT